MQPSAADFLSAFVEDRGGIGNASADLDINQSLLRNFITKRTEIDWNNKYVLFAKTLVMPDRERAAKLLAMCPK